jgi:hypothetical protein
MLARLGELETVAGLVARQAQATDELVLDLRQRRLVPRGSRAVEQLVGHAVLLEDLDVLGRAVELLLGTKQLQVPWVRSS